MSDAREGGAVDDYERWLLRECLRQWQCCRVDAEKIGRPHQPYFANMAMRYYYEALEEALWHYQDYIGKERIKL